MATHILRQIYQVFLVVVLLESKFETGSTTPLRQLVLQGFISMTGEAWPGGGASVPAVLVALKHVNEYPGLLDEYNLTFAWEDSKCDPGVAMYQMFQALSKPPTKIMLLACSCSTATTATAQVSHRFNLTQISPVSASPVLSDKERFPYFFRLIGPDHKPNPAKIAMMQQFNWEKVATIHQAFEFFAVVIHGFVQMAKDADITIISQEIFQHDPYTRVANLKKHDARIIVAACFEDKARLLLCAVSGQVTSIMRFKTWEQAYKHGLYGPKIVWMFPNWFSLGFWRTELQGVKCTEHEMTQAIEGAFLFGFSYIHDGKSIAGITEFDSLYRQEDSYDVINKPFEPLRTLYYDHIWVAALALNCTEKYLRSIGHPKKLDEFRYEDSDINDIIVSCVSNISFNGLSGKIAFPEGSDPVRDVLIERIQDGQLITVGKYNLEHGAAHIEWERDGIKWNAGNIPRDSTFVIHEEVSIPVWLYVTMTSFAGTGILVSVSLFVFNVKHRQCRIVKLSSPNINNVLLLGCVLKYSTVFMKPTDHGMEGTVCKIRILCFSLGFTTAFGALFSKTWRVYKIFTNKKLVQVRIRDGQLIGIVVFMNFVIGVIVMIWEIIGPHYVIVKEFAKDVYLIGNDAEVRPFVRMCYSRYDTYFSWTLYITEGVLLAFGAFLAWETRHVSIEDLNDSHLIRLCLYNVFVLSAVGLTFTLILEGNVVLIYGIVSSCVVIGITLTEAIIFVPKVLTVYGHCPSTAHVAEGTVSSRTITSKPPATLASATLNLDTTVQNSCS